MGKKEEAHMDFFVKRMPLRTLWSYVTVALYDFFTAPYEDTDTLSPKKRD
jgi:hypothetical protein